MGVEGDKGPCSLLGQLSGQVLRQMFQLLSCFHKGLQGQPGQFDPGVLGGFFLCQMSALQFCALCTKPAVLVRAGDSKGGHPVAHTGDALVAEELRFHSSSVQRAGHDLEGAQAALRRPLAEGQVHSQKAQEVSGGHRLCDLTVELRPLRGEAIGTVVPQLVGQVAAGDEHRAAAQVLHSLGDALAQPVVVQRRKSGQADTEDGAVHPGFPQKVQRHKRAVVQIWVPLTQRPDLEAGGFPTADNLISQYLVVLHL